MVPLSLHSADATPIIKKVVSLWKGVKKSIKFECGTLTDLDNYLMDDCQNDFFSVGKPVYEAADGKVTFIDTGSKLIGYYTGMPKENDKIQVFTILGRNL